MIKILDYILTKLEWRLTEKNKDKDKEKLALYRALLNEIDKYKIKKYPDIFVIRHYRMMTVNVDNRDELHEMQGLKDSDD